MKTHERVFRYFAVPYQATIRPHANNITRTAAQRGRPDRVVHQQYSRKCTIRRFRQDESHRHHYFRMRGRENEMSAGVPDASRDCSDAPCASFAHSYSGSRQILPQSLVVLRETSELELGH